MTGTKKYPPIRRMRPQKMQFARVPSTVSGRQSDGTVQGTSKNNFQGLQEGQGLQHYSIKR